MAKVRADISMSLDGFVAGPDPSLEDPLGVGGMQLHEWALRLEAWRSQHGLEGGKVDVDSELITESTGSTGAVVMGRKMYSGGSGPWEDDPNGDGWWGDEPPFHVPVFVVTHHPRELREMDGGTTFSFVSEGVESAVRHAQTAAGERDVLVAGGGSVVRQCLAAGLLDEIQVHVAPVLLGSGVRLFENASPAGLEVTRVVAGPVATHIRYRIDR
jgi:dihydrofolate reductase